MYTRQTRLSFIFIVVVGLGRCHVDLWYSVICFVFLYFLRDSYLSYFSFYLIVRSDGEWRKRWPAGWLTTEAVKSTRPWKPTLTSSISFRPDLSTRKVRAISMASAPNRPRYQHHLLLLPWLWRDGGDTSRLQHPTNDLATPQYHHRRSVNFLFDFWFI